MRKIQIPKQKKGPQGEPLCRWCEGEVQKPRRTFCSNQCVHEAKLRSDPGYLRDETFKRDKGVCAGCGIDTEMIRAQWRKLHQTRQKGLMAFSDTTKRWAGKLNTTASRIHRVCEAISTTECENQIERFLWKEVQMWSRQKEGFEAAGKEFTRPIPTLESPYIAHHVSALRREAIDMSEHDLRVRAIHRRMKRLAGAAQDAMMKHLWAKGYSIDSMHSIQLRNLWQADHITPVAEGGGACGLENIQTLCTGCHRAKTAEQARRKAEARRNHEKANRAGLPEQAGFDL